MKNIFVSICTVILLSACASSVPAPQKIPDVPPQKPNQKVATVDGKVDYDPVHNYHRINKHTQCVPYAREASGIPIRGNAHTWWSQAQGKYECSKDTPKVGAVLVLSKTQRNKYGHVAVVSGIVDARTIEVEHTNWGGTLKQRKIVYKQMPAIDVSANNDWSKIRFWNYPSSSFGRVYPASGFIYPNK